MTNYNLIISLFIMLMFSSSFAQEIPQNILEQHNNAARNDESLQFTFVGSLMSISDKKYRDIDGEHWGMKIKIEKMILGSHKGNVVEIGIDDSSNPPLQKNKKYYITIGWGNHGLYLGGLSEYK